MRTRLWALGSVFAVLGCVPVAAPAAEPVMSLGEVRPGMRCHSLSVIRGTTISKFDVEIVDVLRAEPAGARLLVRVSGAAVDATGIGPGFSGSPIYCRNGAGSLLNAGAISESLGEYGNDVALATPIEEMLAQRPGPSPAARKATPIIRDATPLSAPLTFSGLSGSMRRALLAASRDRGERFLAGPSGPLIGYPRYELQPGAAVATGVSTGDIAVTAVGTVTYRDGRRLWAFGHSFEGLGRRSLPLLDAYVFSVIDNPLGLAEAITYKLAAPGRKVGTLTTDALSAIVGRTGAAPPMIPVRAFARDLASGRTRTLRSDVADERQLGLGSALDLVGTISTGQALDSALGSAPGRMTTRLCLRIALRQTRLPLGFCKRYFSGSGPLDDVSKALRLVAGYKFGPLGIRRVDIRAGARASVREAFIIGAAAPRRVRPGQRIRVRLLLQRSRRGRQVVSFGYRVPRTLKPGRRTLTIRGMKPGGAFEESAENIIELVLGGGRAAAPPRSVPELAYRVARIGKPDGIRATFSRTGSGPVVHHDRRRLIRGRTQVRLRVLEPLD